MRRLRSRIRVAARGVLTCRRPIPPASTRPAGYIVVTRGPVEVGDKVTLLPLVPAPTRCDTCWACLARRRVDQLAASWRDDTPPRLSIPLLLTQVVVYGLALVGLLAMWEAW